MNEIYTIGGFEESLARPSLDAATGTAIGAGVTFIIIGIYLGIILFALVVGIVNYILQAIALFTLAKNRGMKSAWCAWVPFANVWLLGSVSDLHDRQRGLNRHWGLTLLICRIFGPGLILVGYFAFVAIAVVAAIMSDGAAPNMMLFIIGAVVFYATVIVGALFSSVSQFGTYICLYKIFDVVKPEKAVKYIIISLVVPLGCSICMMCARKSMLGVPQELLPTDEPDEYTIEDISSL